MKKLLSLVAVFAMTALTMTSCKSDDDPVPPTPAKESVKLDKTKATVKVKETVKLVATPTPTTLKVTWKSSDDKIATVAEGTVTGVAKGAATITATAGKATATCAVTVTDGTEPVVSKIIVISPEETQDGWAPFVFESDDTENGWQVGGYWFNKFNWDGTEGGPRASIDNYGNRIVGKAEGKELHFTFVDKDTDITESLTWVENTDRNPDEKGQNSKTEYTKAPSVWTPSYTDLAGKSGYIVCEFTYGNSGADIEEGTYKAWIEIKSIANTGEAVIGKVGINCGTESFKVGQEK